jgi:glucosylceramidase
MNRARKSITSVGIAVLFAACGSSSNQNGGSGGNQSSGSGGSQSGGASGNQSGGASGNQSGGASGNQSGGSSGNQSGGSSGTASGGSTSKATGGAAGNGAGGKSSSGGTTGTSNGGASSVNAGGNSAGGSSSTDVTGGSTGAGGEQSGGTSGSGGESAAGGATTPSTALVTSVTGNYWQTGTWTETTSGSATVTVNDTTANQKWEGFGGAFNEMGWTALNSDAALQTQAVTLLFSPTDGANFTMGRIPIGASDYATSRYTDDDGTWTDVNASSGTRQPADTSMANFSIDRDNKNLIPYIKAAMAVKSNIRFWASPWTPPVWMKTGYKTDQSGKMSGWKPSFYDGGKMSSDAATLTAYAQYYTKFVQGYKDQGINIEMVSPQNEPGYEQNYPSCLWDGSTYASWIGKYLGPAMQTIGVKVMLGTLSNPDKDITTAQAATSDSTAKGFLSVVGVQWGVLDKVNAGQTFSGIPIWATEHKCGNYPWSGAQGCGDSTTSSCPSYNSTQAPNDQPYGVETWFQIRNAITKGKVTSYSAWNMVLDKNGLGNDTSRDWRQDALLVADSGKINPTPAYYVFRHLSQYVQPDATVVGTTGGDAVAFKNPDNSLVVVVYNSGAENKSFIVKIGGKMLQFDMPGDSKGAWATIKYGP